VWTRESDRDRKTKKKDFFVGRHTVSNIIEHCDDFELEQPLQSYLYTSSYNQDTHTNSHLHPHSHQHWTTISKSLLTVINYLCVVRTKYIAHFFFCSSIPSNKHHQKRAKLVQFHHDARGNVEILAMLWR